MKRFQAMTMGVVLSLLMAAGVCGAPLSGAWTSESGTFVPGTWAETLWGVYQGAHGNELQLQNDLYALYAGPLVDAEALLEGQVLSEELAAKVGDEATRESKPISDVRSSADYRRAMVGAMTKRAILNAAAGPAKSWVERRDRRY